MNGGDFEPSSALPGAQRGSQVTHLYWWSRPAPIRLHTSISASENRSGSSSRTAALHGGFKNANSDLNSAQDRESTIGRSGTSKFPSALTPYCSTFAECASSWQHGRHSGENPAVPRRSLMPLGAMPTSDGYGRELPQRRSELCFADQSSGLKGFVVLSGYDHAAYAPLERAGWRRKEFDVPAYTSDKRVVS